MDIDSNTHAIVADDGRVFYDLSEMISEYEPRIAAREFAANITKGERDLGYVNGERAMLNAIKQSAEVIALDHTFNL